MIQEYALDPSVLVAAYSQHYGFLRDSFNATGRVFSQYPRKWKQKVMRLLGAAPEKDRKNLEVLLSDWLLPHSITRESSVFDGDDWLIEAEKEDGRFPFHGILAGDNPRRHDRVIPFDEIVAGDHDLWSCVRSRRVIRTAEDIVDAVSPILTRSKKVVLIDPYFLIEPRFCNVLTTMISVLNSDKCVHHVNELQVCTALKGRRSRAPGASERGSLASYFRTECESRIPKLVPSGFRVNFTVYFEKEHGVDAHDRHILTDFTGVDFGQGLDQRQADQDVNHVRVNLLDHAECCKLEDDFQPYGAGASASYHIETEFSVEGAA